LLDRLAVLNRRADPFREPLDAAAAIAVDATTRQIDPHRLRGRSQLTHREGQRTRKIAMAPAQAWNAD
jgi:hypothetical protein